MSKANGAQFHRCEQFQIRVLLNARSKLLSVRQVPANRVTKGIQAVITQRQPQLQRAKAAREFDGLIKKCEALDGILTERLGVIACMRKRPARCFGIAEEEAAAIERLIEPLVRIEGKRVGEVEGGEFFGGGNGGECAVCTVHVQPRTVAMRNVGELA